METRGIKASGEVVHIRVSSEDLMTAVDIIDLAGLDTRAWSLSMVVKWAMSYAFEAARVSGSVPRRDGFEYQQMVGRYLGKGSAVMSAKNKVSRNLIIGEIKNQAAGLQKPDIGLFRPEALPDESLALELPDDVKMFVTCGEQELAVINSRITARDPNVTATEVAKWLLYAENRSVCPHIIEPVLILEAEKLIRDIWPTYPSVL